MKLKELSDEREVTQDLLIMEPGQNNLAMVLSVLEASHEVARLELKVTKTKNGQLLIAVNLQGLSGERGSLSIMVNEQE